MEHLLDIGKTGHALDILSKFDEFRINQQYCDFIIKAGEKEISVHKCVIAASSEYFAKMLNHDTKENMLGMVDLKYVDPECVMTCIDIMYTGQASFLIRKTEKLMYVAHLFGIDKVCDAMSLFLEENLDVDSFFDTRYIAEKYFCQQLQQACRSFARDHFHSIMKTSYFKELEFDLLEDLISSEDLHVLDVIKCKASMIWVNEDLDRADQLFDLLKHIDLEEIPVYYRKFLSQHPTVGKSTECMMYIMKSLPEKSDVETSDYKGDCTPGIIMTNGQGRFMWFDIDRKSLTEQRHFNYKDTMTRFNAIVVMDCYIYVIYTNSDFYRRNFLEYDSPWIKLERPLPEYRYGEVVARKSGKFYLSGHKWTESFLVQYDTINNKWSKLPNKQSIVVASAYTIARDKLYAIGGFDVYSSKFLLDVECFNFSASTWSHGPSLPVARTHASACTLNKDIYFLGGKTANSMCATDILWLPSAESMWTLIPVQKPGLKRMDFKTHCILGKIYICGGYNDEMLCDDILEFNPKTHLLSTLIDFHSDDLEYLNNRIHASAIIL